MNILHIIPTLGVGGAERQLVKLLLRMDATRFNQVVCFYTPSVTFEKELNTAGIPTIFLDKFSMPPWTFFSRLRGVIREVDPEVVHTWLYSANFWGRFAALSCGIWRLVASDRSMARRASAPVVLYEKLLAPITTRLANSRAVAASLERHYGLPVGRTRVISNAVEVGEDVPGDAREGVRCELGLPRAQNLVLMAGRQTVEKNHAMFFRAARRVGERRPDVTFVALGHLPDRDAMQGIAASVGAGPHVRIVDQREDIPRWLAAVEIFCLTSNEEGLPNVVLEAMASGLPVVCTDFESAREVIPSDEVGLVVPRDDDGALAESILALLGDPRRRAALGSAARRHVQIHHGWDRLVRDMEALYQGVISGDKRASQS